MVSSSVDDQPRCAGSSTWAPESSGLALEATWTGVCPVCETTFELGYAGSLPVHPATAAKPPARTRRTTGQSTIGDRVRRRRLELGLSQHELATSGISRTYVSLVELGRRNPSAKALRALAQPLAVSVHWLETGESDPGEELAQLVLSHPGNVLRQRSRHLAQRVLERENGSR